MTNNQILGLKIPIRLGQNGYFDTNISTVDQVSDNIKNLLLTKPGERRFNNEFGSSLYKLLFQQIDVEVNPSIIVDSLQRDIDKFLNGVIVNDVEVKLLNHESENNNKNSVHVKVMFTYNKSVSSTEVKIVNNKI